MSIRFSRVVFILLIFLYTGCSSERREDKISTPTPFIITSTLPATQTPAPSATPLPDQPTTVAPPVEGVTSTQLNVRAEPSTISNVLGILPANTKVEIIGKDAGEHWWQINYPQGQANDGKGWVTAQYVTTATKPDVPITGSAADLHQGNVAIVQQQINVRSGPGTDFTSLGTLSPQDVVGLTGRDANGAWLQIDFPNGPQGKGWVNAAFVQAKGVEHLPLITESGRIVGTGTPTSIPFTPTATLVPAWKDQDSPSNPIASVIFEADSTQTLIYHGDVSSPQGDTEDWITFEPDGSVVFASLACTGGNSLKIEMTQNQLPVSLELGCGDQMKPVPVKAGSHYLIHLQALPSNGNFQYIDYMLTIKRRPS